MEKKDLPALTGIRFIAASAVFLFHYAPILYANKPHSYTFYLLSQLDLGVNLFFVLSGFLITYRYYGEPLAGHKFWLYWCKRAFRILPLYFAILAFQWAVYYHLNGRLPDGTTIFLNLTLLKGLSEQYFLTGVAQSWSLTVEEMFYLYAPLSFFLIRRKRFFLWQIPVLMGVGFGFISLANWLRWPAFGSNVQFFFSHLFWARCFEFFTGMYVALLLRKKLVQKSQPIFTAGGGIACLLLVNLLAFYAWKNGIDDIGNRVFGVALFNYLIPVSFGVFFYGLAVEGSWIKSLLATPLFTLLGKSSYAFYLLHISFFAVTLYFHITGSVLLLYLLLQCCSIIAHKLFEKPLYFYLLRKYSLFQNRRVVV